MHGVRVSLITIGLLVASPVRAGTPVPQFQWAAQPLVGTGNASAFGVAMDVSGNSFVCGTFKDTLNLPTGALRATGNTTPENSDAFLVKYSPQGSVLWARHGGNASLGSMEAGYAVAVDPARNVYMTGEYGGSLPTSFGGIQIASTGGGTFCVKYDADGTIQWAVSLATTAAGYGIATGGSGTVYVLGSGVPTFIKKLDASNGAVLDSWEFSNLFLSDETQLSADAGGNVIFSGTFYTTVDFDPGPGVSNLVADALGDGFIAKYDATGALLWARKLASADQDGIKGHVVDAAGDVYFTGTLGATGTIDTVTTGAGTVAGRLNPGGRALWLHQVESDLFGSPFPLTATRIGTDGSLDYYIVGPGVPNAGTIGGIYTIPPVSHFHLVHYGPSGNVVNAKFVTSADGYLQPRGIAVHFPDIYHVVGEMTADGTFDSFALPDINGNLRSSPFTALVGDITSPVLASLATVEATPELVRLRWYVTGLEGIARVERRREADEWIVLGEAARGGPDYVVYEDRDVTAGDRLSYRLLWQEGDQTLRSDPVQIVVPSRIERLVLSASPNPASGFVDALISVPARGEGTLAMHDLLGREVMERGVQATAAGRMIVRLGTSELPAGLYWLSLRHGGEMARTRVSVVR